MAKRVDFSKETRQALAERAGFRCSFPGCGALTIGPSEEGATKSNRSGMACHIAAASGGPGARRVVPNMTSDELSNIVNGIWMCYKHGKLIDADEVRFTIPMLKTWRAVAELRARVSHELGREVDFGPDFPSKVPLPETVITLPGLGDENRMIGECLNDSCINQLWGDAIGHAVRDLAIEVVRNAFQHGDASLFTIRVEPNRLVLQDNGRKFAVDSLLGKLATSGGSAAINQLVSQFGNRVLVSCRHENAINETVIAFVSEPGEIATLTPCSVQFEAQELHSDGFKIPLLEHCDTTYIVMPQFISFSDAFKLAKLLSRKPLRGRRYVIVSQHISPGVISIIKERVKNCRIMSL